MTATRVRDLLVLAVLFGVLGYLATRVWYLRLPSLSWPPGATLGLVGVFELAMASRLRALIAHDPGSRPMPAVVVARWIAVGRATALAGAVVTGLAVGFSGYVVAQLSTVSVAGDDLVAGSVLVAGACALTVGGVLLERSGIAPSAHGD